MRLADYLARIGYRGPIAQDSATLRALHRAHLLAIPYENLDIHLGRRLTLDEEQIFDKIVRQRRGGWCFEMNGLFAWALRAAGFSVRLLSGTVSRGQPGVVEGNHLILLVELERPYLVDVGFGNGFLEPIPLEPGEHVQNGWVYALQREGDRWIFHNHQHGGPGFDFTLEPRALADFAGQCHTLQTSPESGFVRVAVCHRFTPERILSLRGAVLANVTPADVTKRVIADADDYRRVLREQFDLEIDVEALWPKVWESHLAWSGAT
ncbi:MAG: arylamine N-acetyltransferase [Chloroflexota bacterium]